MPVDYILTDPRHRRAMPDIANDDEGERFRNSLVEALLMGPARAGDGTLALQGFGGLQPMQSPALPKPGVTPTMLGGQKGLASDMGLSLDFSSPDAGDVDKFLLNPLKRWPRQTRYPANEDFY